MRITALPFGQRSALELWSFHIEVFIFFHFRCVNLFSSFFSFGFGGTGGVLNLKILILELKLLDIINVAPSYCSISMCF